MKYFDLFIKTHPQNVYFTKVKYITFYNKVNTKYKHAKSPLNVM